MDNGVLKIYEDYMQEKFGKSTDKLNVVIYGIEMQTCGGLLKYISCDADVKLISFDLRSVGRVYDGRKCYLPNELAPFNENTVVLVSLLYEYMYRDIAQRLEKLGLPKTNIIHARSLAEEVMKISAEHFAATAMDLKVKSLFDRIGKDISTVKYLDIGANNYLLYNNTYLFYRAGASGVLVEANPDFSDILAANRPRDTILMCGCAVDDSADMMTYYKTNRAGYNTFVEEVAKTYKNMPGIEVVEKIQIPMCSMNSIVEQHFQNGHIDYLSVDIEGMGASVVNSLDFSKYSVDIILIEMDYDSDTSHKLYLALNGLGYDMVWKDIGGGKDFLFYKKEVFC